MDRPPRRRAWLRDVNLFAQLALIATAAAFLLSPEADELMLGLPKLQVGDVSPRTLKSSRDFTIADPATTSRLQKEARDRVLPTYDLIGGVGQQVKNRIERAFAIAEPARALSDVEREQFLHEHSEELMLALQAYFDGPELAVLVRAGFPPTVRDAAIAISSALLEHPIVDDKELMKLQAPQGIQTRILALTGEVEREEVLYSYDRVFGLEQARAAVDTQIQETQKALKPEERRALASVVKRLLRPNLLLNEPETDRRGAIAEAAVKMVSIPVKRGEAVLRAGERVTERHLLLLNGMARELSSESRLQPPLGAALIIIALAVALYLAHRRRALEGFLGMHRDLALVATATVVCLLILWISYKAAFYFAETFPLVDLFLWRSLVPFAFGSLLLRFVVGVEEAVAFSVLSSLAAGFVMDGRLDFATVALVGSLAAASAGSLEGPRRVLYRQGLLAGLGQAVAMTGLALLDSHFDVIQTLTHSSAAIGSGLLSALLVALALPAVEVLFGYTTPMKLADLANLNHPLLRDLLVQAPGTYHHSIVVGALAEAGARAIDADPLLARVGGYYHDIGKLKNPRLYTENNGGETSPGFEDPKEIRMHVAEGLALGAKHRVGALVLEIIAQHHGTGAVRRSALAEEESNAGFEAGDMRYSGPIPISREAGLVLLANAIESATAGAEGPEEIDDLLLDVRRQLVDEGQFDACALTLDEIHRATAEQTRVLRGILERRGRPASSRLPAAADPRLVRVPRDDRPN